MRVRKCIPAQSSIRALVRSTILELRHEIFFISNDCGGAYQLSWDEIHKQIKTLTHFAIPLSFCVSGVMMS